MQSLKKKETGMGETLKLTGEKCKMWKKFVWVVGGGERGASEQNRITKDVEREMQRFRSILSTCSYQFVIRR